MYKLLMNTVQTGIVILTMSLAIANSVLAASVPEAKTTSDQMPQTTDLPTKSFDQIAQYVPATDTLAQVTSVSQLSDVQPTDWAFQALQSLVERYGAIAGYPDGTFRGNRTMTRFEFAAGLNAALDRVNELIMTGTADLVRKEDLVTLQRLQTEFATELATLRGRVDALEAATAELEANQFSTTTKLTGDVVFSISGAFGDEKAVPSRFTASEESVDENITFAQRAVLNFTTSFTGKDSLITSLYASNLPNLAAATGTPMTRLGYELDAPDTGSSFGIYFLQYSFPIFGDKGTVIIEPTAGLLSDFTDTINPLFTNVSTGAISTFGLRNPIYRNGYGGGAGLIYNFSNSVSASLAYIATNPQNPSSGNGLFDGSYGALAQLTLRPSKALSVGLTYVHSYNALNLAAVGSTYSNDPFDGADTTADSYGVEANFRVSPKFSIGGWAGFTQADAKSGPNQGADASIFNYAVTLAFPDLGKEGNLAGLVIGQPPKVTDNDINSREDSDTSLHLEAFYRYQVTDNISITPGLIMITNPEHNDNNNTVYLGTIRTTFTF